MEKAFFNAGPAPFARDGQTAAYYQTPNRIRLGELPVESPCPGQGGTVFGPLACDRVLCCIGRCNRILPYFIANMWMATLDRPGRHTVWPVYGKRVGRRRRTGEDCLCHGLSL